MSRRNGNDVEIKETEEERRNRIAAIREKYNNDDERRRAEGVYISEEERLAYDSHGAQHTETKVVKECKKLLMEKYPVDPNNYHTEIDWLLEEIQSRVPAIGISLNGENYLNVYAVAVRGIKSQWVLGKTKLEDDTSQYQFNSNLPEDNAVRNEIIKTLAHLCIFLKRKKNNDSDETYNNALLVVAESIANFQRSYNSEYDFDVLVDGYKLFPMSDLNGNNEHAEYGRIYVSSSGDYVVRDTNNGNVNSGNLSWVADFGFQDAQGFMKFVKEPQVKGKVVKLILDEDHIHKKNVREKDAGACGPGTSGLLAETIVPFLTDKEQSSAIDWEGRFNDDYVKIQENIAIESMDQMLINNTYHGVKGLLKERKILKYGDCSGEFNDLDIIMFNNVKEKMESLKGVFKEDEIKHIKETKSYKNYMNTGFFTYIDAEDIFNKFISRKLTSFAILNCSDLDRWNKLLGRDEEVEVVKKEILEFLSDKVSQDEIKNMEAVFDYSFLREEIKRFQRFNSSDKSVEKVRIEKVLEGVFDQTYIENKCLQGLREVQKKTVISCFRSYIINTDRGGGWEVLKKRVSLNEFKELLEGVDEVVKSEVDSFFSSNLNLTNTKAYKHYLDSPSINSEIDLKEAANQAMADQMMTCVAFELMRKLPNGDIIRFLDGTVLDISSNEDILRFLEKYFDKEDLDNYLTRVNLLDVKKEIRRLRGCEEKVRSEEKRMSANLLMQLSENRFLEIKEKYVEIALKNASDIISEDVILSNGLSNNHGIIDNFNKEFKRVFQNLCNGFDPMILKTKNYIEFINRFKLHQSDVDKYLLDPVAKKVMELAVVHLEGYVNSELLNDNRLLEKKLNRFIKDFINDETLSKGLYSYWGSPDIMCENFCKECESLNELGFTQYKNKSKEIKSFLGKLRSARLEWNDEKIVLATSKVILKDKLNAYGYLWLSYRYGRDEISDLMLRSGFEKEHDEKMEDLFDLSNVSKARYNVSDKIESRLKIKLAYQEVIFDRMIDVSIIELTSFFGPNHFKLLLNKNDDSIKNMAGDLLLRFFPKNELDYFLENFNLDKFRESVERYDELSESEKNKITKSVDEDVRKIIEKKRRESNKGHIHESFDFESVAKNLSPSKRNEITFALARLNGARTALEKAREDVVKNQKQAEIQEAELSLEKILFGLTHLKQEIDSKKRLNKPLLYRILAAMLDLVIVTGETSLNLEIKRIKSELKNAKPKSILEKLITVFIKLIDACRKWMNNMALTVTASIQNVEGYENTPVPDFLRKKKKPKNL